MSASVGVGVLVEISDGVTVFVVEAVGIKVGVWVGVVVNVDV